MPEPVRARRSREGDEEGERLALARELTLALSEFLFVNNAPAGSFDEATKNVAQDRLSQAELRAMTFLKGRLH